jgi:hypothetical protein
LEVPERNSGETAPAPAESRTKASSDRGPIWDSVSNRVKAAMWRHSQKHGVRYSVSICRSYKGDDGKWHDVHFFDKGDLDDVVRLVSQAQAKIDQLEGIA